MGWQDIAIAFANIIMMISLLPQIIHSFERKKGHILLKTSIPTTLGLLIMTISFFTLQLYFSAVMGTLSVIAWFLLIIQKLIYS